MLLTYSNLFTSYFSFFALSYRLYSITHYLAFKHLYFPDLKENTEIMYLPTSFLFLNLSFAPTPSLFLPRFLYFLPLYPLKILVVAKRHAYLLEVLPIIPFLFVFAIFS